MLFSVQFVAFFLGHLSIIYKDQNSRNKRFCSQYEIGCKYLFQINQRKILLKSTSIYCVAHALNTCICFIFLNKEDELNSCIHSTFLIFRIMAMHTNAYTFIYTYEYVFNYYKIIQKLHNRAICLNTRGIQCTVLI